MSAQPKVAPPHYQSPPLPPPRPPHPSVITRLHEFWMRVTDGLRLQQLWSQFVTEARTGYRLYSKEVEARKGEPRTPRPSWMHTMVDFFWAILMKLSPAKRVVLLIGLVLLLLGNVTVNNDQGTQVTIETRLMGGLLILFILILETADRVVMKRDLEIAREIQHWLVPSEAPKVPGLDIAFVTRPANTVAGDYYDVIPRGMDGKQLLVIADVAGKSMPAALLMATFQASLKTLSATSPDLVDLVCGLNRYASDHSIHGSRFTTAFLAEFDPARRSLTFVNAGHNPPVKMRGIETEQLNAGGVPLGILKDANYESGRTMLQAGDVLAIYTDGVVEAENVAGQEFGEDRMLAAIRSVLGGSAQQMLQQLMAQIEVFVGTAPQHDDITCMIVKCI
ncbi:MAG: PP2C family protein-serine/threonine phosphatase [Terriglobales bacterium]